MFDLIVRTSFENYRVGERITNEDEVARLLDSPFVIRVVSAPKPEHEPVVVSFVKDDAK